LEKKIRKEVKIREKRFESIFIIGKIENITYKIGKIRSLFILSQYFSKLLEISFKNDHQLFRGWLRVSSFIFSIFNSVPIFFIFCMSTFLKSDGIDIMGMVQRN